MERLASLGRVLARLLWIDYVEFSAASNDGEDGSDFLSPSTLLSRCKQLITQMNDLFALDREAWQDGPASIVDHEARRTLRMEQAPHLLAAMQQKLLAMQKTVLPKSKLGKAVHYTLSLRNKLTLFLVYLVLELSNNLAENSMRPIALGRENWLHLGSKEAGPKIAAIFSIVESCRRLNILSVAT